MKQNLVIVESPNKIKSLEKYLGSHYKVMASVGHITNLEYSGMFLLGIDLKTWTPAYKLLPKSRAIITQIAKFANQAKQVYIATDPDREGEAIANDLVKHLKIEQKYKRIRFNEITKDAIIKAIENPTIIDQKLINAQQSRRMLDRIIGFRLSKLIRKKISNQPASPTVGRVQSIGLKLVAIKEQEIEKFKPTTYFNLQAKIIKDSVVDYFNPEFESDKKGWILPNNIDNVLKTLKSHLIVDEIKKTRKKEAKKIPFKQSMLYKSAESIYQLSTKQIQFATQSLYEGFGEGGLISYPRTDSTRLSKTFVANAQKFIIKNYGEEYLASDIKGVPGAQDAHEAIRPTDLKLTPSLALEKFKLKPFQLKVYQLIYQRTLQVLIKQPEKEILRYEFLSANHKFKWSSSKIIFDGYLKINQILGLENKVKPTNNLPNYQKGDKIKVIEYLKFKKETQPPSRYSEGSLIQKMDQIGVGRPSTFAVTINKIQHRGYVEKINRSLHLTEYGKVINQKLTKHFKEIINEGYTASVEKELNQIAIGKANHKELLQDFWDRFDKQLEKASVAMESTKLIQRPAKETPCPNDNGVLIFKYSKKGNKFIGCANWPNCNYAESIKWDKQVKK